MPSANEQNTEQYRRASMRVGTTLKGKYKIDRVLGIGGMAVVYAATHRNQAEFAVKMLHPELSMHTDVCNRFLREGYAANSVKHPGVVMVVDDDIAEDGAAFLVMELLRGDGVEELWEKSGMRVAPRVAASIVDQLLDVLSAAHEKGIVHRDIKPANLFLVHDGTVKVLDFGIARARDALSSNGGNHTGTGMLLGTPAFMAPEQALAKTKEIDQQTDVWAAGATLFSLISGQFVHTGENAPQLLVNAATKPARLLSTVAHAPPEIVDVVARSLAFEKSERFPSAKAMQDALREACVRAFGKAPARESLVGSAREEKGSVEAVAVVVPPDIASAPTFDSTAERRPPSRPGTLPLIAPKALGGTTAQPVSNDFSPSPHDIPGVKRGIGVGALIALVAFPIVVSAALFFGYREFRNHQTGAASALVVVSPESSVASVSPVVAPVQNFPQPSAAAVDSATVSAEPSAIPPSTPAHPPHSSRAHSPGPTPSAVVSASSTVPPIPAKSGVAKTSCDPPFFYDAQGRKVFKPECM